MELGPPNREHMLMHSAYACPPLVSSDTLPFPSGSEDGISFIGQVGLVGRVAFSGAIPLRRRRLCALPCRARARLWRGGLGAEFTESTAMGGASRGSRVLQYALQYAARLYVPMPRG